MLIAKTVENLLVEVIGFDGPKLKVRKINECPIKGYWFGQIESVEQEKVSSPCVTDCYNFAKNYHGLA